MMPVSVIQQYIPSPTPVKPKLGFSIDEIVGTNTRTESPKFQSFSPSAVVKPEIPYNYSLTSPRTEVGNVIDSVTRYAQMYNNLPPELRANLDCLGITCPRLQISPTMSLLGTEMQPVHPWFANRHVRYYHPRIQGADSAAYLYHPFRKPKRVRTAFSPSQLLQLEHAFEKNHYVVGNERRQLADALNLTETQVKVWFQNRRTKHKRQKQDDGENCDDKAVDSHQEHSSSDDEANAFEERISEVTHDSSLWNPSDAKVSTSPKMSCETEFSS